MNLEDDGKFPCGKGHVLTNLKCLNVFYVNEVFTELDSSRRLTGLVKK